MKQDDGTWTLTSSSVNTYTNPTTISGGTLVVNGAILGSSSVTLTTGGTLAGNGFIASPVTNTSGVLSPGAAVGTLTLSNRLVLAEGSTCRFEVGSHGYDQVRGLSSVELGGTLQIAVIGDLQGVEVFKLFEAATYNGTFIFVDLPPLSPPLAWDDSQLAVDGTLRVTGGIRVAASRLANGQMQLSGSGPAYYSYRVLASTNVALPLSQWTELDTGFFAADGAYSFTDGNTGGFLQRFYRVVTP